MENLTQSESHRWDAADNLRANSKLTAGEYCMPVLGVIFLRHATNRCNQALRKIQADQAAGTMTMVFFPNAMSGHSREMECGVMGYFRFALY
jgi:hypothetical protein